MFSERKNKWQAERQRRAEEGEELRRSSQQEVDNLRAQLHSARTSTDSTTSDQVASSDGAQLTGWFSNLDLGIKF